MLSSCSWLQLLALLFLAAVSLGFFSTAYLSHLVFPEIGMVVSSQCKNPLRDWDGKVLRVPVARNFLRDRNESGGLTDDPRLLSDLSLTTNASIPVIFWGAHHKTGTYLAQKVFSLVCARRAWCCVFGHSRDSATTLLRAVEDDPVRVMGHNQVGLFRFGPLTSSSQWVWLPEEFGRPYRFVHFFRHPLRRIVSGYRYHLDASESWCRFPQAYTETCSPPRHVCASNCSGSAVELSEVRRFCRGSHLCQACCRREHELGGGVYGLRSSAEYSFLCRHLGGVNDSLTATLQRLPWRSGIRLEASLDYFESLRMARVLNRTWDDPNTLHVDIDCVREDFASSVGAILRHIGFSADEAELRGMVEELRFFDFDRSPLYRWSVSNPLFRHVSVDSAASHELLAALREDEEVQRMYRPVLSLMSRALGGCGSFPGQGVGIRLPFHPM